MMVDCNIGFRFEAHQEIIDCNICFRFEAHQGMVDCNIGLQRQREAITIATGQKSFIYTVYIIYPLLDELSITIFLSLPSKKTIKKESKVDSHIFCGNFRNFFNWRLLS